MAIVLGLLQKYCKKQSTDFVALFEGYSLFYFAKIFEKAVE